MAQKLTDTIVKALPVPAKGSKIEYDTEVKLFGCRVTAKGARSFILGYRTRAGRERRYTIGQYPDWKTGAARTEAAEWKRRIRNGEDPLADLEAERAAPTVADLCTRYEAEHLPKKRARAGRDDRQMIARHILPALKHKQVAGVTFSDVDGLHRKLTAAGTPIRANRVAALLSKMFSLAIKWGWRADNPARGIERNQENKRHRYLTGEELGRLTLALAKHSDQQGANIIRLLLLTGARSGEVMAARWADLDLTAGVWTKPGATTKQKTDHRVPLSGPARQMLRDLWENGTVDAEFVFDVGGGHRKDIRRSWERLCEAAEIRGARIHDLRHTYASVLASAGLSLPVIGALLGHTQASTTHRYAHLFDDPLRAATERVGAIVMPSKPEGEVVPMKGAHHGAR